MKTIDLRGKFEGHVVLWSKNWYGDTSLERLVEAWREWTGLAPTWEPHPKDLLTLIMRTNELLEVNSMRTLEAIMYAFWQRNERVSTYHVRLQDDISLHALILALSTAAAVATIRSDDFEVLLPQLLPDMKYKYELKDAGER
jgi:hypothetical protein